MKLQTRLALAFLFLAVAPLAAVSVFWYVTSVRALRRAVEAEAGALAEDMGSRMEGVRADLWRRIERLGELPLDALLGRQDADRSRVILGRVEAEMGDASALVESLELRPGDRARRGSGPSRGRGRARTGGSPRRPARERKTAQPAPGTRAGSHDPEVRRAGDAASCAVEDRRDPRRGARPYTEKLNGLPLPAASAAPDGPRAVGDWVLATRKDPESGLTLGIARPVGESLKQMRRTAARNLMWGLGLVGVALLGIVPLSRRMTRDLATLTEGVDRLARGDLEARVAVRSGDEIGRLAEHFNRMARDLRVHQEKLLEQERLRKELEMCRRIQEELLPREPLHFRLAEVKGVSIPAREVGGDFFNYFLLPAGEMALLVGDVSGKGVPAALLMANLQATLRARLAMETDLAALAGGLDLEIDATTPPEVYLTLFVGIVHEQQRVLRYVNAGHNTQFLIRACGGLEYLESGGRPLGLYPGGGYEEKRVALEEGDCLFLFTDGLVEAENRAGEPFGAERLPALLLQERGHDVGYLLARVEAAVRAHRGGAEASDDATMLVLRVGTAGPDARS